jgi:hypothetical protein
MHSERSTSRPSPDQRRESVIAWRVLALVTCGRSARASAGFLRARQDGGTSILQGAFASFGYPPSPVKSHGKTNGKGFRARSLMNLNTLGSREARARGPAAKHGKRGRNGTNRPQFDPGWYGVGGIPGPSPYIDLSFANTARPFSKLARLFFLKSWPSGALLLHPNAMQFPVRRD